MYLLKDGRYLEYLSIKNLHMLRKDSVLRKCPIHQVSYHEDANVHLLFNLNFSRIHILHLQKIGWSFQKLLRYRTRRVGMLQFGNSG